MQLRNLVTKAKLLNGQAHHAYVVYENGLWWVRIEDVSYSVKVHKFLRLTESKILTNLRELQNELRDRGVK